MIENSGDSHNHAHEELPSGKTIVRERPGLEAFATSAGDNWGLTHPGYMLPPVCGLGTRDDSCDLLLASVRPASLCCGRGHRPPATVLNHH